ncbi:hypothetical protein IAD21_04932 [Abditibacteriota bacterium]|nr:hypothetical protein IAD21_04932 [Abditibacteriota bacterium]
MNSVASGLNLVRTVRQNYVLAIGLLLLAFSFHEFKYVSDGYSRYQVAVDGWRNPNDPPLHFKTKWTGNRTYISFQGQNVQLWDAFKMAKPIQDGSTFDVTKMGTVHITVNGRDYTNKAPYSYVRIRTEVNEVNRYFSQVMVAELTDKWEGKTRLAILQSSPAIDEMHMANFNLNSMTCRIVFVDGNGKVEEETFDFGDRNYPYYRGMLVGYVSPIEIGLIPQGPLLYAFVSGFFGLVLTWGGLASWKSVGAKN